VSQGGAIDNEIDGERDMLTAMGSGAGVRRISGVR